MASKKDTTPIDVTWEDQRGLCTFGRMHRRFQEIDAEIRRRDTDIEKLTDAADEIIIADDVKYVFGESFITLDCDDVSTLIETKKASLEAEAQALRQEKEGLEKAMAGLKSVLYAKFGSQVYLESE
ncbi:prefoldin-like protein, putative [Bodo saltans]|uniref:Prefoldin subunit 4 n=1 Tax=Bodo saltans TaxID=75058 RepID=A0A0S4J0Y8_BODSA|nr:prefoldin-like protein, putative [Bodo saltans]|eukprot:CUG77071.1 prefoldin-like protein, putative [Bodo saltans]